MESLDIGLTVGELFQEKSFERSTETRRMLRTWMSSTCPVSLSRAAMPTSRPTPLLSRTATTKEPSCREDAAVRGRAVFGRDWAVVCLKLKAESAVEGRVDVGRVVAIADGRKQRTRRPRPHATRKKNRPKIPTAGAYFQVMCSRNLEISDWINIAI